MTRTIKTENKLWDFDIDCSDVTVGVMDSGIQTNHEDLIDNIWVNTGEIVGDGIDNDGNGYIDDIYGWNCGDSNGDVSRCWYCKCGD